MVRKKTSDPNHIEMTLSDSEIENGIRLLKKRLDDVKELSRTLPAYDSATVSKVQSKLTETVKTVYGSASRRVVEVPNLQYPFGGWCGGDERECHNDYVEHLPKAIGWVESHIESLEERLEERAPDTNSDDQESWSLIHPLVYKLSKKKFDDQHYADSVETALKAVNQRVKVHYKKQSGIEDDGVSLMQKALSPKTPIIVLGDQSTESGRNEQQGYSHSLLIP